jgi:hypothetical protein
MRLRLGHQSPARAVSSSIVFLTRSCLGRLQSSSSATWSSLGSRLSLVVVSRTERCPTRHNNLEREGASRRWSAVTAQRRQKCAKRQNDGRDARVCEADSVVRHASNLRARRLAPSEELPPPVEEGWRQPRTPAIRIRADDLVPARRLARACAPGLCPPGPVHAARARGGDLTKSTGDTPLAGTS